MAAIIRKSLLWQLSGCRLSLSASNSTRILAQTKEFIGCSNIRKRSSEAGQYEEKTVSDDDSATMNSQQLYNSLYPGHISTSMFQKSLLAVGSGIAVFFNPARADMLCSLAETTGVPALRSIQRKMLADSAGRQILQDKPIMTAETLNVDYLGSLPDGTLGKQYWHFLQDNGFSPDDRLPVNFIDDAELMYIMLRYRQCHDIIHAMIGMPPNMLGEVVVKWYEMIHTQLPMCTSAALLGPLRLGPKHRKKFRTGYLPWVVQAAPKAKNLMTIYFEKHWEQDVNEFRKEMFIEVAPPLTRKTGRSTKSG